MKLLANGEAITDGVCKLCKKEHRLLSDEDRAMMTRLGFTGDEIDAVARDQEKRYQDLERGSPDFHVKPSTTAEASRERKRRSRARARGE